MITTHLPANSSTTLSLCTHDDPLSTCISETRGVQYILTDLFDNELGSEYPRENSIKYTNQSSDVKYMRVSFGHDQVVGDLL